MKKIKEPFRTAFILFLLPGGSILSILYIIYYCFRRYSKTTFQLGNFSDLN